MTSLLRTTALALPLVVVAAVIVACSSDDDTSSTGTFTIALTVAGQGRVVTAPTGLDCQGPRDCGSHEFAGPAVTLTTTPATGWALARTEVDDVATAGTVVQGAAGAARKVTVTFAPATDASDPIAEDAGVVCTSPDACAAGMVCCVRAVNPPGGVSSVAHACEGADACRKNDSHGEPGYPLCTPPTDATHCTPGEACIEAGPSTYLCQLPRL